MSAPIHFAHGNGFPSGCYTQLLNKLRAHHVCHVIDKVGHHPDYPVTENWDYLVDEVIASIEAKAGEPVIAIGHSLGGVLSLLAAIKKPQLFAGVILIDSPLLGRFKSRMVKLAKTLGFIDHVTPARRTRGRRRHWRDKEQLLTYLKTRPLFASFTEACLRDYMKFGVLKDAQGYKLAFDSRVEYEIFRTIPHHLSQFAGQLKVPATLIYGSDSDVLSGFDVRYMKYHYQMECIKLEGSHMLPMENPQRLAMCLEEVMQRMNGSN